MKQIGVALHNYHSSANSLPLGASLGYFDPPAAGNVNANRDGWSNWSAHSMLLPFLEQEPIYNSINFEWSADRNLAAQINLTARNTVLNVFLCPSDGNAGRAVWLNNYFASQGTATYNVGPNNGSSQDVSGLFPHGGSYSLAAATDGTSNTIAFSESLVDHPRGSFAVRGNGTGNVSGTSPAVHGRYDIRDAGANVVALYKQQVDICTQKYQTPDNSGVGNGPGSRWAVGAVGYTIFNTVLPPNGGGQVNWGACRVGCCVQAQHAHFVNAMSNHSGGVNILLADGSVRFTKDSINLAAWWGLGTKDGGELISSDQY